MEMGGGRDVVAVMADSGWVVIPPVGEVEVWKGGSGLSLVLLVGCSEVSPVGVMVGEVAGVVVEVSMGASVLLPGVWVEPGEGGLEEEPEVGGKAGVSAVVVESVVPCVPVVLSV